MYITMQERDAGKQQMIMTIINSMSTSERKIFLNNIYGMCVDTDSVKVYNHYDELLYKIREIDNATEKTFKTTFSKIKDLNIHVRNAIEIDNVRINAQAETIEKLCKIIKFILPRVNANPFCKEYEEIKKVLEDIYKEF